MTKSLTETPERRPLFKREKNTIFLVHISFAADADKDIKKIVGFIALYRARWKMCFFENARNVKNQMQKNSNISICQETMNFHLFFSNEPNLEHYKFNKCQSLIFQSKNTENGFSNT